MNIKAIEHLLPLPVMHSWEIAGSTPVYGLLLLSVLAILLYIPFTCKHRYQARYSAAAGNELYKNVLPPSRWQAT